jgi:tRNA dimethylallyltransferase
VNHLVAIVGPTGVGKSRLALHLAQAFNGEVISADSRQVYRYMDIGTAKPSRQELSLVSHHLIDIINPNESFSLAQYQELARRAIESVIQRQRMPLLVGGSGQYVWAVLEGWGIPKVPPNKDLRNNLEARATIGGNEELHHELERNDPAAASRIDPRNVRRVIRALEIQKSSTISHHQQQQPVKSASYNTLIIGLTADRAELYQRIDARVDAMIEQGLVEEVKKLMDMGYSLDLPSMSGIGYRQIGIFLKGEMSLEAAIQQIKFESHRFVRQQYNWFNPKDDKIKWFDIRGRIEPEIKALIDKFISSTRDSYEVY